jgi:propionyl-CoA carboxylase alpha chain
MINKVLVANRGEIAQRVFRTCRAMGISTVAVYSDADADAPFVLEADEAVPLGGTTSAESYLRIDAVLDAAARVGADAIHPGYGFLSENAEFARRCQTAGVTFIGPTVEAIEAMGSKLTARDMMQAAGVPVLPGRDLTGVADKDVLGEADEIGWPVLVKASYGGGGRGMRVVRDPAALIEAIASARREAGAAFGNDTVFLEHYVDEPRHVEIQIFGDAHGSIVHLNERECSIQRRHQKIIEEAPSPVVDAELRDRMGSAAVEAGRALSYLGAGTVEFLLAPTGDFYFLEVNTRLQVEHPVTELITGLDLVRMQIEVASGLALPPEAFDAPIRGHAIEARLYAEDAINGFLPAAGLLHRFEIPEVEGVRVDGGVASGDVVSTNYDPMLAKVIGYGRTREEATARLSRALRSAKLLGVTTNRTLLVGILENEDFVAGRVDTHFLDRMQPRDLVPAEPAGVETAAVLAAALADQSLARAATGALTRVSSGFRTVRSQLQERTYLRGEREIVVGYAVGRSPRFEVGGTAHDVTLHHCTSDRVDLVVDGVRRAFEVVRVEGATYVTWAGGTVDLIAAPRFPEVDDALEAGSLLAQLPGTVVRVNVAAGDTVSAGDTVLVIEAMKMEHAVKASRDAVVASVPVREGTAVEAGAVLVVLEENDDDPEAHDD